MSTANSSSVATDTSGLSPVLAPVVPLEQYSFFQALRQIERQRPRQPRIGYATRPIDEMVRIGQPAELSFAPATLVSPADGAAVRSSHSQYSIHHASYVDQPIHIQQRFLGLLGPAGPMPLHFTETVRDRKRHAGDDALQAFLDIFHHRAATLFYRAWSDAQPVTQQDRPNTDKFARFLAALAGALNGRPTHRSGTHSAASFSPAAEPSLAEREVTDQEVTDQEVADREVADREVVDREVVDREVVDRELADLQRYFVGHFSGIHQHAEGLRSLLASALQMPVQVESFALRTLTLEPTERTKLTSYRRASSQPQNNRLGHTAQLGINVADRNSMVDIQVGPMGFERFRQLLPGGRSRQQLSAIVRQYAGPAVDARVTVVLDQSHVPGIDLGRSGQLGRTCWLGGSNTQPHHAGQDRADYRFEVGSGEATQHFTLPVPQGAL